MSDPRTAQMEQAKMTAESDAARLRRRAEKAETRADALADRLTRAFEREVLGETLEELRQELQALRDQRDRAVEALRAYRDAHDLLARRSAHPDKATDDERADAFMAKREAEMGLFKALAALESREHHPRIPDRPDVSTTDHERTPQDSSSGSLKSDTEDR
jgi:chromosome segregation ATPase